jgi:hypothetical protein
MDIDNGWNTPLELAQMASEVRAEVEQRFFLASARAALHQQRREWVLERPRRKAEEEGGGPLGRPGVLDF